MNRSFQLQMKKKMIESEIAGQPIGITTFRMRPKYPQPSMVAASSSSLGMLLKFAVMSMIVSGRNMAQYAMMTPR